MAEPSINGVQNAVFLTEVDFSDDFFVPSSCWDFLLIHLYSLLFRRGNGKGFNN